MRAGSEEASIVASGVPALSSVPCAGGGLMWLPAGGRSARSAASDGAGRTFLPEEKRPQH